MHKLKTFEPQQTSRVTSPAPRGNLLKAMYFHRQDETHRNDAEEPLSGKRVPLLFQFLSLRRWLGRKR